MIARKLKTLIDVGLSYVRLGQPATTLSGGEAQRVKLSRELSKRDTGNTLYILDEPTTGLHFHDIQQLLNVLHRLRDQGNTVVVIEHNLDVIKTADWLIDLGPEGGGGGGRLVAEGTPEQVARVKGSYTGQYLAPLLEPERAPGRAAARKRASDRTTLEAETTKAGKTKAGAPKAAAIKAGARKAAAKPPSNTSASKTRRKPPSKEPSK